MDGKECDCWYNPASKNVTATEEPDMEQTDFENGNEDSAHKHGNEVNPNVVDNVFAWQNHSHEINDREEHTCPTNATSKGTWWETEKY